MDAKHTLGEPRVLISCRALLHNAAVLRRRLAAGTRLCAIIKANAYGHGADLVADALCNCALDRAGQPGTPAADAFAVASLDEAAGLSLRANVRVPVIVFRPLENAFVGRQRVKIEEAVRQGWVLTVCSPAAAEDLARIALSMRRRADVQVMVDTGMTRSGVAPEHLAELLHRIDSRPSLRLVGVCTHFASSEEPASGFTREQLARFTQATAHVPERYRGRVMRHAANSAAIFLAPDSHLDMVRPGLALYGIDPTGRPNTDRALRPAMRWTAPLIAITDIPAGATVGYGQTWTAARPTRVGLVPVGYADGYPRRFSNRAKVLVHGHAAPVIGRVSMDLTTIDLTDVPHSGIGDEVVLLDSDPLSPVSVYQLARWAETIPYEIFCGIGPRVHRVAVDGPETPSDGADEAIDPTSAGESVP